MQAELSSKTIEDLDKIHKSIKVLDNKYEVNKIVHKNSKNINFGSLHLGNHFPEIMALLLQSNIIMQLFEIVVSAVLNDM